MAQHSNREDNRRLPERRRRAGKTAFNRALAALGVAAAGWTIGFLIPSLSTARNWVFFPVGGIVSFFFAFSAIMIGARVRKFIRNVPGERRRLLRRRVEVDLERQSRFATLAIALGILSLACNPLLGFLIVSAVR